MVSFTVKVKCDFYGDKGQCQASVHCECEMREESHHIPEMVIDAPSEWQVDIRRRDDYLDQKGQCLCPEHNPWSKQNIEKERKKGKSK